MINNFSELPDTEQGLKNYIAYANKQIKHNERINKKLQELVQEAHNKIGDINGRFSINGASKA